MDVHTESPRVYWLLAFFPVPINPGQNGPNLNLTIAAKGNVVAAGEKMGILPLCTWLVFWKLTVNLPNLI